MPFSFSPGVEEGVAKLSVLRLGQRWHKRSQRSVFLLRSALSIGLDTFDATQNSGDIPDGQFTKLELQTQFAYRFAWLQSQFVWRSNIQYSDSQLLGLEQFAIGGHNSVRGYRENSISGDNGALASIEWRVPLWRWGTSTLELSPFADTGYRVNDAKDSRSETLSSIGIGLRWKIANYGLLSVHWADAAQDLDLDETDLQDEGLHASFALFF